MSWLIIENFRNRQRPRQHCVRLHNQEWTVQRKMPLAVVAPAIGAIVRTATSWCQVNCHLDTPSLSVLQTLTSLIDMLLFCARAHCRPALLMCPVACDLSYSCAPILHYSLFSLSEVCILSVLGRVSLRAWVPTSQRESHSQWSSRRVGQGPRLTQYCEN